MSPNEKAPLIALNAINGKVVIQKSLFESGGEAVPNRTVRYWAERGIIRAETHDIDGNIVHKTIPVDEFEKRLRWYHASVSKTKDKAMYRDEIAKARKFINEAIELIKLARFQGDPFNDQVFWDKINHGGLSVSSAVPDNIQKITKKK